MHGLILLSSCSPALARYGRDAAIAADPTALWVNNMGGVLILASLLGPPIYKWAKSQKPAGSSRFVEVPVSSDSAPAAAGARTDVQRPEERGPHASGSMTCLTMVVCGPMALLGLMSAPLIYSTGGIAASIVALGVAVFPLGLMARVLRAYFRSR